MYLLIIIYGNAKQSFMVILLFLLNCCCCGKEVDEGKDGNVILTMSWCLDEWKRYFLSFLSSTKYTFARRILIVNYIIIK